MSMSQVITRLSQMIENNRDVGGESGLLVSFARFKEANPNADDLKYFVYNNDSKIIEVFIQEDIFAVVKPNQSGCVKKVEIPILLDLTLEENIEHFKNARPLRKFPKNPRQKPVWLSGYPEPEPKPEPKPKTLYNPRIVRRGKVKYVMR